VRYRVPHKKMPQRRQRGSALLESLLALVVFSVGLVALLALLSATLVESGNANHRSEASLLAADLIARMWNGDRSLQALQNRFGDPAAEEYRTWLQRVRSTLPGITDTANQPQLDIDADRRVTLTLHWQTPADRRPHELVVHSALPE
jgi:type IV pilus assembly protein PilV